MNIEADDIEARTSRAFERVAVAEDCAALARTALSRFENLYPSDDSFCSQAKKRHLKRELIAAFIELEEKGHGTYKYALEAVEILRRCDAKIRENKYLF